VKFAWIDDHPDDWPVAWQCATLDVSRSGYYAWRKRPAGKRAARRAALAAQVRQAHADSRGRYGSPRVHAELRARGVACNVKTVARLMRQNGLQSKVKRRFRVQTTDSNHDRPVADNRLAQQFVQSAPNRAWAGDITYVPTAEGWLYVAVVLDLYSRRVIGWSMAEHLKTSLVVEALTMAIQSRRAAGADLSGLVHHSDRGVQYASEAYQAVLQAHGLSPSMSRRGNCYDNAVVESFMGTLKTELVHHERYATREQARQSIFEYLEVFYNRQRRHSSLGYVSPADFEAA
jgi:transposase InsO family protein